MGHGHQPTDLQRRAGFSLVELMMVIVIMTALTLSLVSVFTSSQGAVAELTTDADLDARMLRALERLDSELSFARLSDVTLVDAQTLNFATVVGWDGTDSVVGNSRWVTLVGDELMLDNTPLVDGVTSLAMTLVGNVLTVDLGVESSYSAKGGTRAVARKTTVRHRFAD